MEGLRNNLACVKATFNTYVVTIHPSDDIFSDSCLNAVTNRIATYKTEDPTKQHQIKDLARAIATFVETAEALSLNRSSNSKGKGEGTKEKEDEEEGEKEAEETERNRKAAQVKKEVDGNKEEEEREEESGASSSSPSSSASAPLVSSSSSSPSPIVLKVPDVLEHILVCIKNNEYYYAHDQIGWDIRQVITDFSEPILLPSDMPLSVLIDKFSQPISSPSFFFGKKDDGQPEQELRESINIMVAVVGYVRKLTKINRPLNNQHIKVQ